MPKMNVLPHVRRAFGSSLAVSGLALSLASCGAEEEIRPQLLVVVDTDAPVVGQLRSEPEVSSDAVIDTIRIDGIGDDLTVTYLGTLVAPDRFDWPVSFGIATPDGEGGRRLRLRMRAYDGAWTSGSLEKEPPHEVSIDRVVDLELPAEGIASYQVVLRFGCLNRLVNFVADPPTSCVDQDHPAGMPTDGVRAVGVRDPLQSSVGTAAGVVEVPCAGGPPADDVLCIPGGFSVQGDLDIVGDDSTLSFNAVPLRPAVLSPFWIDRTEYTVGRFRQHFDEIVGAEPTLGGTAADPDCTWRGRDDPSHDDLPLNCVSRETALEACAIDRGTFPSEAQWEHAARGRGQRRRFPWGDAMPSCCTASISRTFAGRCADEGVEPVGSHPISEACDGLGDVSRDGVLDLGGSMTEMQLDQLGDDCWGQAGVGLNPVCQGLATPQWAARGGNWVGASTTAMSALRREAFAGAPTEGFRCAYEDTPP